MGCFVLSLVEIVPVVLQLWKVYNNEIKQRCQETELLKPVRNMGIKKNSKKAMVPSNSTIRTLIAIRSNSSMH